MKTTTEPGAADAQQAPALLRRLLRAKDRMDAASHEDWPVKRLAEVSGVSEAHFARSFKQAFGIPPHRYLLTRRIEQATTLLPSPPAGRAWAPSAASFATSPGRARPPCAARLRPPHRSNSSTACPPAC